ncbi:MAG: hypothetical protein AAB653_01700 [Patescibacteria group bacterium]
MEKSIKITYILFLATFIGVITHNLVSGVLGMEDFLFFIISMMLLVLFIGSVFYNLFSYLKFHKPEGIWMLGWLGFFGLLGLLAGENINSIRFFYAWFVFFGFFGFKK